MHMCFRGLMYDTAYCPHARVPRATAMWIVGVRANSSPAEAQQGLS